MFRSRAPCPESIKHCKQPLDVTEIPIGQQATFSLWQSNRHLTDFAYEHHAHTEVIKRTYKEGWYGEEMFCRFAAAEVKQP